MFFSRGSVVMWYHFWGCDQKLHQDLNDRMSMRGELQMSIRICYAIFTIGILLFLPIIHAFYDTTPSLLSVVIGILSANTGIILCLAMIMVWKNYMDEMKTTPYENLMFVIVDKSSFDELVEFCKSSTNHKWKAFAVMVPTTHYKDELRHGAFSFANEADAAKFKLYFG